MKNTAPGSGLDALTRRLDSAMGSGVVPQICEEVKRVLIEQIAGGGVELPEAVLEACDDGYARRLLHRDPGGRYTIVVMVWGVGQTTPIHDHAGKWCVECVYQGRIRVESFAPVGDPTGERVDFTAEDEVFAGVGEAGALIPPHEYHVIANPDPVEAVTVHVYGGEMDGCHKFLPRDGGGYRREWCGLCYTS